MKKLLLSTASAAILLGLSAPAYADAKDDRIQALEAQLQALVGEVQALKKDRAAEKAQIEQKISAAAQAAAAQAVQNIEPAAGVMGDVKISMKPSPKIESADGKYSFQPFGRVHLDATFFDDDKADHPDNANFRRARLGFKGNLGEDFEYKSEFDFGEEGVNFKEVTLAYTGLDAADIKIGHQKPSFGMENNTSSNYLMFIERAAPTNAFTRDEEIGLNILAGGDNWSLGGGVFNEDAAPAAGDPDEQITFDVRGSVNLLGLIDEETASVLHLGAGYSYRDPHTTVSFAAAPAGEGPSIINTGNISSVEDVGVYSAELAAVFGPVSFQGEYFNTDVNRSGTGNSDIDFDGYYAQAGLFLTGESRPYKGSTGNFGRVKPQNAFSPKNGGWGAWELLARYENVDLNDNGAGITGGELKNTTVGLNWHLTDYIRLMADVTDVDTDSNAATADDDPTVYNLRAQWDF